VAQKITFKITDHIEPDLLWEEEECRTLGIHFAYYQLKDAPAEEIIKHVKDADLVLVNMARISAKVIAGLPSTKLIIRHGIGYDNVDVAAATGQGIIFANEATASSEDVAEHAVMLILETYKKKNLQNKLLRRWVESRQWSSDEIAPLYRLSGKTLGIVGCGNIGSRVFKKMVGFGLEVLVCDPYLSQKRLAELGLAHTPFEDLLKRSDIVTIHVPVTEETQGMFDREAFSLMKRSAVVINTARGPIIKTTDLVRALREGTISGAGLDVFEKEPPEPGHELLYLDNVVLSPHVAWYSEEGGWDIRRMIMDDVKAFLRGKPPRFVVNPEVFRSRKLRFKRGTQLRKNK
jgi:D-3-phosphoglycerate dehydrogenase